jgi:hypothetical protein
MLKDPRQIEGRPWTDVLLISGLGIPQYKKENCLKTEGKDGKTDLDGKESANGVVPRFILICHSYKRNSIVSAFLVFPLHINDR